MERYYATGNKRICDQDIQKHQREKRRSNFNHYKNLNLNGPVNFISSGNDHRESKNDEDNNDLNRNPSPPPPPMFKNNEFEFHQNQPQLKGIGGKLLLQMGYEPGKGLGKNLQGIQVPIKAKPRLGRGAIGAYGPENLNSMPIETVSNPFRRFGETNKKVNPGTTDVLPNNLMFLTHQISSMSTTNENFNSLDIVNNLETGLQQPSTWPSFMNSMRSNLLENFGYDPRNDSKILFKSNYKNLSSIYNSRNQNTNRNGKPKIIIPNVSDSLKLAVIDRGDPEGKIRNVNHQKILRELLDSALFQKLDQSPRTVTPLFHWSGFKDDIFKIICQDEQTKIWLIELIQNVGNLWFDADLCLVGLEDFVKFRHSLNKKENFQIHNQKLAKMLKHVSRQFDANWRESERNERKLFEKLNGKLRHRNSQKTIENRNFKSEPDFLLKLESIPELLKIAIIDKNDIEGKIINIGHQNLLEEALYNAILKISEDPDILPRYRWSGFRDNIFKIYCYDEQSKICMEEMVKNVRNLWEGADLVVVGMEEFSHFQQTRKYNFEPENNKFSNEYDDNWKTDEQIQFEDLGQIRNKPSYRNPKDQRKPNVLKSDISTQGFLINIRKITNEKFKYFEFKAIKESLDLLIYETIKTGEFFPQFENVTMNCEDLCIHCANLSTQEWFSKYIIPKFNLYPPWQDAEFKFDIINNEENILEKRIQAKIWFFGLKFKTDDYLKMLQAQNDSLATNLWTVENRKDASDGVHLYVTLDKLSALIINSLNKRPYFGSGRAEVKF